MIYNMKTLEQSLKLAWAICSKLTLNRFGASCTLKSVVVPVDLLSCFTMFTLSFLKGSKWPLSTSRWREKLCYQSSCWADKGHSQCLFVDRFCSFKCIYLFLFLSAPKSKIPLTFFFCKFFFKAVNPQSFPNVQK